MSFPFIPILMSKSALKGAHVAFVLLGGGAAALDTRLGAGTSKTPKDDHSTFLTQGKEIHKYIQ